MTIITKLSDKKKLLPIPTAPIAAPTAHSDVEADQEAAAIAYAKHRARTATLLVCLLGVLVLLTGVLAGVCFYRQYLREKVQRLNLYMPYEPQDINSNENVLLNSRWKDGPIYADSFKTRDDNGDSDDEEDFDFRNFIRQIMAQFHEDMEEPMKEIRQMEADMPRLDEDSIRNRFFREEFELKDDDEDSYADIKIPDFRDGRRGRFIHDYKNNQTTIVDEEAKRCFVYPLDYTTTLAPKSMLDVIIKMQTGYYFPDTNVLRKKMRVVTPEMDHDDDYISSRTQMICKSMKIYKLEPFVGGVFKRSITNDNEHSKFAEFSGNGIVEYDFVNFDELERYEGLKN
jgi:integral membrane protein 2B